VAAGGGFGVVVWNVTAWPIGLSAAGGRPQVTLNEPPICARCGTLMQLRARHVQHSRIVPDRHADMAVVLSCPRCHGEGAQLTGSDAIHTLRQGLTYLNSAGGRRRAEMPHEKSTRPARRSPGARHRASRADIALAPAERGLALEMAVDERAEVEELERQWREAEEIADIATGRRDVDGGRERVTAAQEPDGDQPSG